MTIEREELGPAVGRVLLKVFDAIESWSQREQASREIPARAPALERLFGPPAPLPLVSNLVVRRELNEQVIAWLDLHSRKYTFKRDYLLDGNLLATLPDPHASLREFFASGSGTLGVQLCLLEQSERSIFTAAIPGEVETFIPGKWVEDFLALYEAIAKQAHEEAARTMLDICRLGYWQETSASEE